MVITTQKYKSQSVYSVSFIIYTGWVIILWKMFCPWKNYILTQKRAITKLKISCCNCGSGARLTALIYEDVLWSRDFLSQSPLRRHSWSREGLVNLLHSNLSREPSESRERFEPSLSSFLFLFVIRLQESVCCLVTSRLRVRWSSSRDSHRGRSRYVVYSTVICITWLWYNEDILSRSVYVRGACLWNYMGKNGKRKYKYGTVSLLLL